MEAMSIHTLEIEGFKSYSQKQTLDFSKFDEGFYFVTGKNEVEPALGANGAGKSDLFESLCWVLFGKTSRMLRASDIVSWGKKTCKVTLTFNNGRTLMRQQSPNKIELDGETVTQEEVNEVLNTDFEPFLYSVLIAQRSTKFFDLGPADKLKVFTKIMEDQLEPWLQYSEQAKANEDQTLNAINKELETLANIQGRIDALESNDYTYQIEVWDKEQTEKRNNLKKEIKETEEKIKAFKVKEVQRTIQDLELKKMDLNSKVEEAHKDLVTAVNELNSEQTKNQILEHDKRVIESNQRKVQGLTGVCSFCGQSIDKAHVKKELLKLSKQHNENASAIKHSRDAVNVLNKKVHLYTDKHDNVYKAFVTQERLYEDTKSVLKAMEQSIKHAQENLDRIDQQLKKESTQINPYSELEDKRLLDLVFFNRRLHYQNIIIEEYKEKLEVWKYLKKGFKDIRLMVMQDSLKEFEVQINNNLQQLGMIDWEVVLDIEGETKKGTITRGFTLNIISPYNDKPVPFESWSGGEAQRLVLAGTLGLIDFIHARRGTDWDIEVYDEPSQFLSEQGIDDLLENLYDRARSLHKKVFIIDHRSLDTRGEFDGVLSVVKKTGKGSLIQ